MVDPVTWHPAADRATPEALVAEQDRSVVPLSTWLADAAVLATTSGRVLQVLTPAHSRITYPLEVMLNEGGGQWVVRDGNGFRDGVTGVWLAWSGARFVPADGAAPAAPPVDVPPGTGSLEVQISTPHPATDALDLGASTEAAVRALTGAVPAGWGIAEPVTQPWSPRELTAHCRNRAPSPTSLVVVGGEQGHTALGQLRIERVSTGVLEQVRLAGPTSTAVGQDAIEALAEDVAGSARSMIVAVHPVRLDGLRPSWPSLPALPYGILVGHQVVTERGVDHAQNAPAARVSILGRGTRQACWCRLDGGPVAPYELLTAVLQHFKL